MLMQVALHCEMEREAGSFDINDVCDGVCKKLIYRHPHVFGDVTAENPEQALNPQGQLVNTSLLVQDQRLHAVNLRVQQRGVAGADVGVLGAAELLHIVSLTFCIHYSRLELVCQVKFLGPADGA